MAEKAKAEGNNFVKKLLSSNLTWSIVAFILLVIICTIFQHDFLALSWNSNTGGLAGPLITMLQESARYLMIATGMTLVISTAGIDLSVGSVMAVAGAAAMQTLSNGMNVWLSILIALAVGLAIGCVNGALVSFLGLQPFITTLIMMLAGRGMAKVIRRLRSCWQRTAEVVRQRLHSGHSRQLRHRRYHCDSRWPAVPQDRYGHDD